MAAFLNENVFPPFFLHSSNLVKDVSQLGQLAVLASISSKFKIQDAGQIFKAFFPIQVLLLAPHSLQFCFCYCPT